MVEYLTRAETQTEGRDGIAGLGGTQELHTVSVSVVWLVVSLVGAP